MKPFLELYKYDFAKEMRKKPTFFKGSDGKMQKSAESKWLDYVEWATVLVALYNVGEAKSVSYKSDIHPNKKNTLAIKLNIDGVDYLTDYPIIDGNAIIENPNQMQIHKAELRGFVKAVAIHTGLGLSLWQKEESVLNELLPQEPKKEQESLEANVFLDWVNSIDNCITVDELGVLYKNSSVFIESHQNIKTLFTKRRVELTAKK